MLFPSSAVSIEIGTHSVKVAQVLGGRRGVRAIRFAEQPLPASFRWEIDGDRGPLVEAIRQALARAGVRTHRAILALPRWQVTARISALPPADRDQLQRVVEQELADHIPFPIDQVVLDFQPLGPSREQPGLIDVLVVAVQRDLVKEYLLLAEELGLKAVALTVDALALHDLTLLAVPEPTGLVIAVDMGARAATINISEAGRLRLTRSVGLGGQQLSRAIQQDMGLEFEEAEELKQIEGLRLLSPPRAGASHTAAWLENLLGEIRRSALSCGPAALSRILLIGGGAATPGLREAIEAEFAVEVTCPTAAEAFPEAPLHGEDGEAANRALLAMAQGLRSVGRSIWSISLLLREVLEARRAHQMQRVAMLAALLAVAMMVGWYVLAMRGIAREKAVIAELKREVRVADKRQAEAKTLLAERKRLREQVEALGPVRARRYAALEVLRAIALYAPQEVVVSHFRLRPAQPLEIQGTAPTSAAVADMQHAIGLSPLVSEVNLTGIRQTTRPGRTSEEIGFSIQARLRMEPKPAPKAPAAAPWGEVR